MQYPSPTLKNCDCDFFPAVCGVWEEKLVRENVAGMCGVRKWMLPLDPPFVRLVAS